MSNKIEWSEISQTGSGKIGQSQIYIEILKKSIFTDSFVLLDTSLMIESVMLKWT